MALGILFIDKINQSEKGKQKIMKIATLTAYKDGKAVILIKKAITRACTLADFQDQRIRYIENSKHYFDNFETTLTEA